MARFRGSNWKKSRRLGISLSGTGKELEKRPYAPGQHGPNQRKKLSEYGIQLREKQKLRYLYGITERQFHNTFIEAGKQSGVHGENFMRLLARRLDAVVYALGLARTRRQARQLVSHGHIEVDGGRVNIPSYTLKPGQVVSVREKSQKLDIIQESVEINNYVPEYLDFDEDKLSGTFVRIPERSELPAEINEQLIVEYYSGK
ncbi:30S ribosomal protein S4 [Staphylococcus debuckii]|uniref:30S ribosomal protein S4 n=1 Tax=Staphylococcus debuckii TaxID=2044912 RepID=UPI000F432A7E|nr:30S ribosomal protein S4 [Staphylococcus debuckii]AYU55481.1 30S ribosomal protein S4 [Staphylococcus debuckii]